MAVGNALTRADVDNAISGYATKMHAENMRLGDMVKKIQGMTDAELSALYPDATEKAEALRFFNAWGNVLLNVQGLGVVADGTNAPILITENAKYLRFGA